MSPKVSDKKRRYDSLGREVKRILGEAFSDDVVFLDEGPVRGRIKRQVSEETGRKVNLGPRQLDSLIGRYERKLEGGRRPVYLNPKLTDALRYALTDNIDVPSGIDSEQRRLREKYSWTFEEVIDRFIKYNGGDRYLDRIAKRLAKDVDYKTLDKTDAKIYVTNMLNEVLSSHPNVGITGDRMVYWRP